MSLTNMDVRQARPAEKPFKLYDGKGLFLLVHPNGSKYWQARFRYAGREKLFQIGSFSEVSLSEAREKAADARKLVREGINPVVKRRLDRDGNIARSEDTFERIALEWLEKKKSTWTPSVASKVHQVLNANIFPRIGSYGVTQLTAPIVIAAVSPIADRGAYEQAHRAWRWISQILRYAQVIGRSVSSPIGGIRPSDVLPSRKSVSYPHLKESELGDFLRCLTDYPGKPETRVAVSLLMHTFVRTKELRGARWDEFDFDSCEWRVPAERMKMGATHVVPLSTQVVALLNELKSYTGYSKYLFPNPGKHPYMSENTINKAIKLLGFKGRIVGHGFRHTASTILNESGEFDADVIERQLSHKDRNEIRAAYNKAQHLVERGRLMQWWSDRLEKLAQP